MANTKYSDLLQYVMPDVAGCSTPLAEIHIRDAVIEFCRRSKVWVFDADPIAAVIGDPVYDIELPAGATLVDIRTLSFAGVELAPSNIAHQGTFGLPKAYRQRTPEEVILWPTPDTAGQIDMTVAVAPTRHSSGFPDWIGEKYHDGLIAGAKARLMIMPGHLWTNPQLAGAHRMVFDTEVAKASADALRSFTRTVLRTTPQY